MVLLADRGLLGDDWAMITCSAFLDSSAEGPRLKPNAFRRSFYRQGLCVLDKQELRAALQ